LLVVLSAAQTQAATGAVLAASPAITIGELFGGRALWENVITGYQTGISLPESTSVSSGSSFAERRFRAIRWLQLATSATININAMVGFRGWTGRTMINPAYRAQLP
jgi:hypothetical protein